MRAWPLMASLVVIALTQPGASAGETRGQPAQAKAKDPTGEDLAQAAGASLIGKYAPPLTLTTLDGKTIDLARLYGRKPVYLKFWATWCVPCRLQMQHFENVQRTLGGDIEVVAVNAGFNESRDAVRRYRETMGLTMPIVIDDGRLADALHLRISPSTSSSAAAAASCTWGIWRTRGWIAPWPRRSPRRRRPTPRATRVAAACAPRSPR